MRASTIIGFVLLIVGLGITFGSFYWINSDINESQNRMMSEAFHREDQIIEEMRNRDISDYSDAAADQHYRMIDMLEKRKKNKDIMFRRRQEARKNGWTPMDGPPPPLPEELEPANPTSSRTAPAAEASGGLSMSTLVAILGLLVTLVIGAMAAGAYFLLGGKQPEAAEGPDPEMTYVDHGVDTGQTPRPR